MIGNFNRYDYFQKNYSGDGARGCTSLRDYFRFPVPAVFAAWRVKPLPRAALIPVPVPSGYAYQPQGDQFTKLAPNCIGALDYRPTRRGA